MLLPLLPVLAATGSPTIVDKDNIIADCTNVTDCTAELQAAFDTCARIVTVPALIGPFYICLISATMLFYSVGAIALIRSCIILQYCTPRWSKMACPCLTLFT